MSCSITNDHDTKPEGRHENIKHEYMYTYLPSEPIDGSERANHLPRGKKFSVNSDLYIQ